MGDIIILVTLLLLSGFFSGAEVALLSVTQVRLRTYLKQKRSGAAALKRLKDHSHKMIITILIGNNVINIAAATYTTIVVGRLLGPSYLGIGAGALTLFVLVFGEITPKTLASAKAGEIALIIARPIELLSIALTPAIYVLDKIVTLLNRFVGETTNKLTEADIRSAIELGAESKIINPHEQTVMQNALTFHDISVTDVMTPKDKMVSLDGNRLIKDVVDQAIHSEYSRFPVFNESPERIIGVVHIKDIFDAMEHSYGEEELRMIAKRPVFVPAKIKIDNLFRTLQDRKVHLVFVRNSASSIAGLVTMEDLLEELLGEITDEYDISSHEISRFGRNTIIAHANTKLSDINEFLDTKIPTKHKTVASFLKQKLKTFRLHEEINVAGVTITIENVQDKNIRKVKITKHD